MPGRRSGSGAPWTLACCLMSGTEYERERLLVLLRRERLRLVRLLRFDGECGPLREGEREGDGLGEISLVCSMSSANRVAMGGGLRTAWPAAICEPGAGGMALVEPSMKLSEPVLFEVCSKRRSGAPVLEAIIDVPARWRGCGGSRGRMSGLFPAPSGAVAASRRRLVITLHNPSPLVASSRDGRTAPTAFSALLSSERRSAG